MKCTHCQKDIYLQCSDDAPHKVDGKPVCEDCYFRELGDLMERHPIGFHYKYKTKR